MTSLPITRSARRAKRAGSRLTLVVLGAFGILVLAAGAAFAYFTYTDSSHANPAVAQAGSIGAGQTPTGLTVSGRDVSFSWNPATNASTYTVARTNTAPGGLSSTVHGACAGSVAAITCTDIGLPENGTASTAFTYTDTPSRNLWQGSTSPASAMVNVPGPSLSVATSSFTTAGGSTNATVANFFDNEAVTYCLDTQTLPCTGAQVGTGNVPSTTGTVTNSLTIPSGKSVGSHTVFAVGSAGSVATAGITITVGAANKLAFTTQPTVSQNIQATGTGSFAVSVAVQDAFANTETGDNSTTVSLAINNNAGSGVLTCANSGGTGPVTVSSGIANFTGCAISKSGTGYTLKASSAPPYTAPTNANAFNITAGTATTIAVSSGSGQSAAVGTAFTNPLVALVTDANGNPVSGVTVSFTGPATGATATFAATGCIANSPTTTCTATSGANGLATSSAFTANTTAGGYSISAAASGTNTATFSETNTAGAVSAATSTVAASPTSVVADGTTTSTVTVTLKDANGNPVSAKTVTLGQGSGSSTISAASGASTASGVVTFTVKDTVAQAVTYTATDATDSVTVTQTATLTFTAGTATKIAVSSGSGQSAIVNTAFTNPLVALVTDANNNPVSAKTVTFTAPASGASGTFRAAANGGTCLSTGGSAVASCVATTNASGLASSLTFTANATLGGYNVVATSAGTTPNPLNFAETNTTPQLHISALSGSGALKNSQTWGATVTVTVVDQSGTPVSGVTVSGAWSPTALTTVASNCAATTNSSGQCTVTTGVSDFNTPQPVETWRALNLTATNYTYNSAANVESSITVNQSNSTAVAGNLMGTRNDIVANTTSDTVQLSNNSNNLTPVDSTVLILIYRHSSSGDAVTVSGTAISSPALVKSNTPVGGNTGYYEWIYQATGTATSAGTVVTNFTKGNLATEVDVIVLSGENTTSPVVQSNAVNSSTATSPATASLTTAPTAGDGEVALVGTAGDTTSITATPATGWTQFGFNHSASSQLYGVASFFGIPAAASQNFALGTSDPWGTVALEIRHS